MQGDITFQPAFYDFDRQEVHLSRYADGRPAPIHVLDGLPEALVADRAVSGRVARLKASVIPGFVRDGFFYTRAAVARAMSQWSAIIAPE